MYKRVLIKLSGEALAGSQKTGLDHDTVHACLLYTSRCV